MIRTWSEKNLVAYKKNVEEQERQIKDEYNRIKVKVKEIHRGYTNAVDAVTRSGSGKVVKEHFDKLQKIWSGSPSVSALPIGLCSQQSYENNHDESAESQEDPDVISNGELNRCR